MATEILSTNRKTDTEEMKLLRLENKVWDHRDKEAARLRHYKALAELTRVETLDKLSDAGKETYLKVAVVVFLIALVVIESSKRMTRVSGTGTHTTTHSSTVTSWGLPRIARKCSPSSCRVS